MFIARAAAVLALLGAAPAAAENLRHLKNGAKVEPAGPKGDDFGEPGAEYGAFCAAVLGAVGGVILETTSITEGELGAIFGATYTQVSHSVVNKKGKGKYTCHAKEVDYELLAEALTPFIGEVEGPIKLSGLALAAADEPVQIPCNPEDPNSYDWTVQVTPSGNVQMKCSFQLDP